ncbi:MAG: ion channel [Bacteroidia bacterium]|nr:ion channel [Bacteroidia bacterium]
MPKRRFRFGASGKADDQLDQVAAKEEQEHEEDLGFGTSIRYNNRLINRDGTFNIQRVGLRLRDINPYVFLVTLSWWKLFFVVLTSYVIFNSIFALIYVMIGVENLSGGEMYVASSFLDSFAYAFFFSAQTFTTVGYGAISPTGMLANVVAAFEAMIGLLGFAVATGVLWGRFSQPSAKIGFSKNILVSPYQDINGLMFRIVNRRKNQLIELEVLLTMMWHVNENGRMKQEFARLSLERDKVALFPLTWTIVHPIDKESPMYGKTLEELSKMQVEFLILIKAYDDTFAQNVHIRMSYSCDEILYGGKFVKIFDEKEEGGIRLEMDKISLCEKVELNEY